MNQEIILSPTDFVAAVNQSLEFAFPFVTIEGELSNFRVSKNRWVYFDLKDEFASVKFFGTIYQLPGPLEDGIMVRVTGVPRMHPRFGFSITFQSLQPLGEGSLKKAADLLFKKLEAEGLFAPERKRPLPDMPTKVGLITAVNSAAAADFVKILNEKWGGVDVDLLDVYVQGEQAPAAIVEAINYFNEHSDVLEVLVITRGGGSAEDLAAFSDERVVRAVASSRIPTLVAIGHEVDISLAELAADQRASTPSNTVQLLVPDKKHELQTLDTLDINLAKTLQGIHENVFAEIKNAEASIIKYLVDAFNAQVEKLNTNKQLIRLFNPEAVLERGYILARMEGKFIKSVKKVKVGDNLELKFYDGTINTKVEEVKSGKK